MSETMYITGVVIPNGIPDSDGDCLFKKDIKTIFTKFLDQSSDVLHDRIKHENVHVLANWITEVDIEIAGKTAPAGSWLATLAVDNEEIKTAVNNGELTGLSLGSVSEDALTRETWFINKAINYKELVEIVGSDKPRKTYSDLDDIEEVHPFWISLVDKPANGFGFDVSEYTAFINKRAGTEVDKMTNENEEFDKISISGWGKITDMFRKADAINKSEEETEPPKEEDEDSVDDISNKELLEALPGLIAEGFKNALLELKEETSEAEEIDKAEDEEEPEDEDSSEETETEEETESEETEDDSEGDINKSETETADYVEETAIDKRQTSMPTGGHSAPVHKSFNERNHRDHLGRKIRS